MSEALNVRDLGNARREIERLRKELRQATAAAAKTREEAKEKMCEFARALRIPLTTIIGFSDILSANDKSHSPEWSHIAIASHDLLELIETLERSACVPLAANGQQTMKEPSPASVHTVLQIEDNETNFHLTERILEDRANIELLWAATGAQGFELAVERSPALILLDLNLPDIHGSEILGQLRNTPVTQKIPVIILSSDASPTRIERMLQAGARDYLIKPFDIKRLLCLVDEVLYSRPQIAA